jgi:hypothetical protein
VCAARIFARKRLSTARAKGHQTVAELVFKASAAYFDARAGAIQEFRKHERTGQAA